MLCRWFLFVAVFIGARLAPSYVRRIGIPLTTCILIFVLLGNSTIGERMSRLGIITTSVGWMRFILLILGIFLVYKASKESRLLDMEIWMKQLIELKTSDSFLKIVKNENLQLAINPLIHR